MEFRVVAVERGTQMGAELVAKAPLLAGRSEAADLRFRDARVAGNHAMLWTDRDALWIRDLATDAGTWVNGRRLVGAQAISPTDEVVLGEAGLLQVTPIKSRPTDPDARPYVLEARSSGPRGIEAMMRDPSNGRSVSLVTDNRAVLLYLMARKRVLDIENGDPADGWLSAEDAIKGLWGCTGMDKGTNRLDVLLYRLRRRVGEAGLDGACIVKRNGHLRVSVDEVKVD